MTASVRNPFWTTPVTTAATNATTPMYLAGSNAAVTATTTAATTTSPMHQVMNSYLMDQTSYLDAELARLVARHVAERLPSYLSIMVQHLPPLRAIDFNPSDEPPAPVAFTVDRHNFKRSEIEEALYRGLVGHTGRLPDTFKVRNGQHCRMELPDGTRIDIKPDGSCQIDDSNGKVTYRASRVRDFNPFINASDKLEAFIKFCGEQGVKQGEMLDLPIQLFVAWLVIEAAKADKEPEPDIPLIPDLRRQITARCVQCGRFMKKTAKAMKIEFCRTACFEKRLACT